MNNFSRRDFLKLTGAGVAATSALRKDSYHADTPLTVPRGRTVTTVDLVKLMLSPTPPILIDVLEGEGHKTLPGAYWIRGPGWYGASEDANADTRDRLGYVLEGLSKGNKAAPLTFFCEGYQCWLSYNASLRAHELGYTNVQWYRGGVKAWEAAKLETLDAVQYGQMR